MTRKRWVAAAVAAVALVGVAGAGGYAFANLRTAKPEVAQAPPVRRPSPSPSPSLIPTIEPAPSPTPVPCRIAVAGRDRGSGGFVTLPDGTYTVDPTSNVGIKITFDNGDTYDQTFGLSFDNAHAKWLPVPRDWVSPGEPT